eukprot:UN04093
MECNDIYTEPVNILQSQLPILISESQTSVAEFDSEDEEESIYDDSETFSDDEIPLCQLLLQMEKTNEHLITHKNGYKYLDKICDTLQGELIKAEITTASKSIAIGSYVAIKKSDKSLLEKHIAVQDSMNFCVDENLIKEASILKKLTGNSSIVQYIDFFESDSYVYLVMEYIDNALNLKEFVNISYQLMRDGK